MSYYNYVYAHIFHGQNHQESIRIYIYITISYHMFPHIFHG